MNLNGSRGSIINRCFYTNCPVQLYSILCFYFTITLAMKLQSVFNSAFLVEASTYTFSENKYLSSRKQGNILPYMAISQWKAFRP